MIKVLLFVQARGGHALEDPRLVGTDCRVPLWDVALQELIISVTYRPLLANARMCSLHTQSWQNRYTYLYLNVFEYICNEDFSIAQAQIEE